MSREIYDFSKVPVTKETKYLKPGQYILGISNVTYVKPDGKKPDGSAKTPFLDITFSGNAGEITQKFYITPKAFERIQTLHMNWFDKTCDKAFDSTDAIGAYFEKAFNHEKSKQVKKRIVIGGRQTSEGKVFAEIPYKRYILSDNIEFEEGEFVPGTHEYIFHVRMEAPNPSTNTSSVMIPGTPLPSAQPEFNDDLPF